MLFKKKLTVPKSNETKEIDSVQLWEVEWESRHGQFWHDTRREFEVFTSEEKAKKFYTSLVNAFKFLKHTSGNKVEIRRRQ